MQELPKKIGIMGLIGSGKDTFGNMLLEELKIRDCSYKTDSYARPLKKLAAEVLGLDFETIDDRNVKEVEVPFEYNNFLEDQLYDFMENELELVGSEISEGIRRVRWEFAGVDSLSPRDFYQKFGTNVVRCVWEDAWVVKLQNNNKRGRVLVTDVRFENEMCDINILVCKKGQPVRPLHISEQIAWKLQFDVDYKCPEEVFYVFNDGVDLESLRRQAAQLAKIISDKRHELIAENVVFTSDDEGNNYYIPYNKTGEWSNLFDYGRDGEEIDVPDWATLVEGEIYVVDIKEKI